MEGTDTALRVNILGVGIDPLNMDSAIARVESWIAKRSRSYSIFRDVHGVMRCQDDPELKRIHREAGMVTPDGMPMVWLSRAQSGLPVTRVYGPDFLEMFCRTTRGRGYRHFFYGAVPSTLEKLVAGVRKFAPDIEIVGTLSPPFRSLAPEEVEAEIAEINAAKPDIVWVGLSTPKQEIWMNTRSKRLNASALMGIGAAFDFVAGTKPQAPRWMQRNGLEWVFRFATEPRRLAGRYLRTLPLFAIMAAAQLSGLRRYD